eukprot:TRINITY_DN1246_c0_g2_i1.p2 TRINITY_DN1246_c0_g2~~TRINITY_DN1246_c0_g2_i1.p2  ORF type:complete len:119 (+),score=1.76 TRINITY_DN1246_c0_g2_i1:660-1016(+)
MRSQPPQDSIKSGLLGTQNQGPVGTPLRESLADRLCSQVPVDVSPVPAAVTPVRSLLVDPRVSPKTIASIRRTLGSHLPPYLPPVLQEPLVPKALVLEPVPEDLQLSLIHISEPTRPY